LQEISKTKTGIFFFAVILATSVWFHWPQFSKDLIGIHLWRQAQTGWNIRNFYRHDFNILNPRSCSFNGGNDNIYRNEFPVMQWMIAGTQKIFGESVVEMRICLFIIDLLSIFGMYSLLQLLFRNTLGSWMGAWVFCFSPLFFYYTINPLPDNFALCCSIWFLYFFFRFVEDQRSSSLIWSAVFLSLATLAKLPFIILAAGVGIYVLQKFNIKKTFKVVGIFMLFLLPPISWYIWVIPTWSGNGIITGMFKNGISRKEVQDILDYHFQVMFPTILMKNPLQNPNNWLKQK